jgi:tetratricopeptide (TPR) repeat protein
VLDDNVLLVDTLREDAEIKSRMLRVLVEDGPDLIEELYAIRMEDPDYGPVRNLLARRLYQEKNYKRALEVDPGNAGSCFQLGVRSQQKGDLRGAIQYYERALARRPHYAAVKVNLPKALRDLGLRLLREGRAADAIPRLRRALEIEVRPETLWLLADALSVEREFAEANEVLQEAVELYPENRELLARAAWLRATSPDPALRDGEEALRIAERLMKLPSDRLVRDAYAAALAEVGRFEEAVAAAEEAGLPDRAESYRARRPWRQ